MSTARGDGELLRDAIADEIALVFGKNTLDPTNAKHRQLIARYVVAALRTVLREHPEAIAEFFSGPLFTADEMTAKRVEGYNHGFVAAMEKRAREVQE